MRLAAAALAMLGLLDPVQEGPPARPTFSSGVDAVRVDVLVTNKGKPIAGLSAGDFVVRDNGVAQQVRSVVAEQLAIDLLLVLDQSGSVSGEPLAQLQRAVRTVVSELRPGDRAGLVTFSQVVRLAVPVGMDVGAVSSALDRATGGTGATALRDAAYAALLLRPGGSRRVMVVVFSDGADTVSWLTPKAVLDVAKQTDVVVYTVASSEARTAAPALRLSVRQRQGGWLSVDESAAAPVSRREAPAPSFLEELAALTGGRALTVGSPRELQATFVRALAEMRSRYVLTYVPEGVTREGWHWLEVSALRPGAAVVFRPGYQASSAGPP